MYSTSSPRCGPLILPIDERREDLDLRRDGDRVAPVPDEVRRLLNELVIRGLGRLAGCMVDRSAASGAGGARA
jgi:hypothetical protein